MKAFGFDFDGTIINIEPEKARVFGEIVGKYWGVDKGEASDYWHAKGGTSRRAKFDYFYEKKFKKKLGDDEYKLVEEKFSLRLKKDYYPKIRLLPGALSVLKFVRANFDFVFVSSGVPLGEIRYLVNLTGLSGYFDLVLGTSKKYLSKKEHFEEIIKSKKPDLLVYLADGIVDMQIAKELGIISIGIPTNRPVSNLRRAGADYISSLSNSISLIKKLLSTLPES